MTGDDRTVGVAVLYGGPGDGMQVDIALDPDSGQPMSHHRTLTVAPGVAPTRPDAPPAPRPPDVSYVVVVDKPTGVAHLDGQGRFRYVPVGTKL